MNDRFGLPMGTNSPQAADHYSEGLDMILSQQYGAEEEFQEAVEADEGFALAHAAKAYVQMIRVAVPEARESASRASALTSGASRRIRQHVETIELFTQGKNQESYTLLRQHIGDFPGDALQAFPNGLLYCLGRIHRKTPSWIGEFLPAVHIEEALDILEGPYPFD